MSKIIFLYQCDPEFRLMEAFNFFVEEANLKSKNIDTSALFIQGHPIQASTKKEGEKDTYLPRCGVEWQTDEPTALIGDNYERLKINDRIRETIRSFRNAGNVVAAAEKSDAEYEQVSWKNFNDFLSLEGHIESYQEEILSNVEISGWASDEGGTGRKTMQSLYFATMGLRPLVTHLMRKYFKVDVTLVGQPEINLRTDEYDGGAWGFSFMLGVKQIRRTFRFWSEYHGWPKKPDIYAEGSRTQLVKTTE